MNKLMLDPASLASPALLVGRRRRAGPQAALPKDLPAYARRQADAGAADREEDAGQRPRGLGGAARRHAARRLRAGRARRRLRRRRRRCTRASPACWPGCSAKAPPSAIRAPSPRPRKVLAAASAPAPATMASPVYADALASHAAPMLGLLAEVARTPSFPDNEVKLAKANALQALKAAEAQPVVQGDARDPHGDLRRPSVCAHAADRG